MPLELIDLSQPPGYLVQRCASCETSHRIALDRAAAETAAGPFSLAAGDTLELSVDGGAAVTVTFEATNASDLAATTPEELAPVLAGVAGLDASVDDGRVRLSSATTGAGSRLEVLGGSAQSALGLGHDALTDPSPGRPQLGVKAGDVENPDVIALRRCACGANEMLVRTFDAAPVELAGSRFDHHRRAVNALASHFVTQGWVHPDLASVIASDTRVPADTVALHAGSVLELPAP